jgi:hypothetical protein
VVELKSRTQSKYSGNKPSELGEIIVWIPISFKRTPAAAYLPAIGRRAGEIQSGV